MTRTRLSGLLVALLSVAVLAGVAVAGEPTDRVRSSVDELYRLAAPATAKPAERRERDLAAARVLDRLFDWTAMARQTLRQHWDERTPAEREEFTRLFGDLFRHAYLARLSLVDATGFKYTGEKITDDRATVTTQVMTKRGSALGVAYAMGRDAEQGWRVHDVRVEGLSILDSYRTQFASIIARSSYEALVERLRTRVREQAAGSNSTNELPGRRAG